MSTFLTQYGGKIALVQRSQTVLLGIAVVIVSACKHQVNNVHTSSHTSGLVIQEHSDGIINYQLLQQGGAIQPLVELDKLIQNYFVDINTIKKHNAFVGNALDDTLIAQNHRPSILLGEGLNVC